MTDKSLFVPCRACHGMSFHVRHDAASGAVSVVCAGCKALLFAAQAALPEQQQRRAVTPI
jgi:hypothetical protein